MTEKSFAAVCRPAAKFQKTLRSNANLNVAPGTLVVKPQYENIPFEMRSRPQWVGWKKILGDNGRVEKLPINPHTGRLAESDDLMTWGTFPEAVKAVDTYNLAGIGFVFCSGDPFVGVDFDHIDMLPDDVKMLNSYTERSQSGKGIHVVVKGKIREAIKRPEIEIYDRGRFFVMTGDHVEGTPTTIEDRKTELKTLFNRYRPEREAPRQVQEATSRPLDISDSDLINKAMNARNGDKFRRLWAGDTSLHGSDDSAADLALCDLLVWWTEHDLERVDRLFRQSGLMRDKWEREDYRQRTIEEADKRVSSGYTGLEVDRPKYHLDTSADTSISAYVAQLEAENAELQRLLTNERQLHSKILAVLRNPAIKSEARSAVAVLLEIEYKQRKGATDEQGFVHIFRGNDDYEGVAHAAGVSPQTFSRHLDRFKEWGLIEKERRATFEQNANGKFEGKTALYVRQTAPLLDTLDKLATLQPELKPGKDAWGGTRKRRCPDHPNAELKRVTKWVCSECGQVVDEDIATEQPGIFNLDEYEVIYPKCQDDTTDNNHRGGEQHEDQRSLYCDYRTIVYQDDTSVSHPETMDGRACVECGETGYSRFNGALLCKTHFEQEVWGGEAG